MSDFAFYLQLRESYGRSNYETQPTDEVRNAFEVAERIDPGVCDAFVAEVVSRIASITMSPETVDSAIQKTRR